MILIKALHIGCRDVNKIVKPITKGAIFCFQLDGKSSESTFEAVSCGIETKPPNNPTVVTRPKPVEVQTTTTTTTTAKPTVQTPRGDVPKRDQTPYEVPKYDGSDLREDNGSLMISFSYFVLTASFLFSFVIMA